MQEIHVVASPCVGTKDTACMPACPVDCIYLVDPNNPAKLTNNKGAYLDLAQNLGDKEYPTPTETAPTATTKEKDLPPKMVFIKRDDCIG